MFDRFVGPLLARVFVWLIERRYRIKLFGWDKVLQLKHDKICFFANHPSRLDPFFTGSLLWRAFRVRPVIWNTLVNKPIFGWLCQMIKVVPFDISTTESSFRCFRQIKRIVDIEGANVLIYPAGELSGHNGEEHVKALTLKLFTGKSNTTAVAVTVVGFDGSRLFSRSPEGRLPPISNFLKGLGILLLNGIFFMPKKKGVIVFEILSPEDWKSLSPKEAARKLSLLFSQRKSFFQFEVGGNKPHFFWQYWF